LRDGHFERVWIQPAAGDAGGAVGAALSAYHGFAGQSRRPIGTDGMTGSYLGPGFSQTEIEQRLTAARAKFSALDEAAMIDATARALADQKAVGWFDIDSLPIMQLARQSRLAAAKTGFDVFYPEPELCTDNGAMIAFAASLRLRAGNAVPARGRAFSVRPRWDLASLT